MSPPGHTNTLRLGPSKLNLIGSDGKYAGPDGQTFIGRHLTDAPFTFSLNMEFALRSEGYIAGASVFLTQVGF
ncbi:uncharacterized protein A1O5_11283 [Cladophialophora psammophila CBS 110553]|uniref:Uncharacterized protein n=1 Tax=Cladophialophora psammophila CBS 110553 TaxID=1182543 RepID=W9WL73_9EURO|nr:uncharacterized protein A1O5_11283 [Cladophialophora psammophila CBS 110553]EXJ65755.1 hypothetical protein A1O5_11283 [Cladophialophora psammophila CBS 110553]